jgi:hypothetical protein
MIDFTALREKKMDWSEFAAQFSKEDLVHEINELTDKILEIISRCSDFDVSFEPHDPDAHDPYAEDPEDEDLGWNLGHVIVHLTASNEESAFLGAEMARGVEYDQRRSRYELAWQEITTVAQVIRRLEESRRMVLGSLEMWPDEAHLDNYYETRSGLRVNPIMRVLFGFNHADGHLGQIEEIIRQACAARE